jgi:hypothetical protein
VAARAIEQRFGLAQVQAPDRTARPERSRTDERVASRLGLDQPVAAELRDRVSAAVAQSSGREDFAGRLQASGCSCDGGATASSASPAMRWRCRGRRTRRVSRCGTPPVACPSTCPTARWIGAGGQRPLAAAIPSAPSTASPHSSPRAGWTRGQPHPPSLMSPTWPHDSFRAPPVRRCGWPRAPATARAQPGGGSNPPSAAAQAAVRTLAFTGPTGQLLARVAGAWRQVATARERDGEVTAGTAAAAAARAAHGAAGSVPATTVARAGTRGSDRGGESCH